MLEGSAILSQPSIASSAQWAVGLVCSPPPASSARNNVQRHLDEIGDAASSTPQVGLTQGCRMALEGGTAPQPEIRFLQLSYGKLEAKSTLWGRAYLVNATARLEVGSKAMDPLWRGFLGLSIAETFQSVLDDSCLSRTGFMEPSQHVLHRYEVAQERLIGRNA